MKVAVLSLRFSPGHVAHLRAYRELFNELGCEVRLFLNKSYVGFIDDNSMNSFINSVDEIFSWKPDKVFSYNIANENMKVAKICRNKGIPFYYVLHEPWDSFKELLSLGKRAPRRVAANIVNYFTSNYSYKVILASSNGIAKFEKYMKHCNKNYALFPLIFCDDYDEKIVSDRKYFSFIGGFTEPRGCSAFLNFIKYSVKTGKDTKFCIATRNNLDLTDPLFKQAIDDGLLVVYSGKPMTSEEINFHYRESICSWNAYISSTQSGVLPNALMQGSPVLVTNRGDSSEIISEKREGCFISLPHNNDEIDLAYNYIKSHFVEMSKEARKTFLSEYLYMNYLDLAKEVYEIG